MTVTRSDNGSRTRERAKAKEAFGRVPLLVTCGNRDIRDTFGTTQRDIIALRDGHGPSHSALSLSGITLGGR